MKSALLITEIMQFLGPASLNLRMASEKFSAIFVSHPFTRWFINSRDIRRLDDPEDDSQLPH